MHGYRAGEYFLLDYHQIDTVTYAADKSRATIHHHRGADVLLGRTDASLTSFSLIIDDEETAAALLALWIDYLRDTNEQKRSPVVRLGIQL